MDPAARPSLRFMDVIAVRQMAARGAGLDADEGAGLGSGRLNATARGGASFSAPVSRGTMRGAGMEAFFAASALCEGGGRGDDASADRDGWTGRGKDKRQLRWAISNRRGRGGRSGGPRGRRGGTGTHRVRRDVEAEVLHPRDGRPGPEGVTHLLFERRGSGDGARRVSRCRESVAETRDEGIQGRGSAGGRAGPTGDGGARCEPRLRRPLRDAAGTEREMEERWSSVGARARGGAARRGWNRSRRDVAPRCRGSEAGGCARTVLRAVLGVFARRCSPPSSAVRKGCGWIGGRRRRQVMVVGSLARVSRLRGGCVSGASRRFARRVVGDAPPGNEPPPHA